MYGTRLHQETSAEELERLLDGGWNVDAPGWMGETPLHSAAERGLPKIALVLIRRGANVNARRPDRFDTPLHFASNAEVARVLIEHGAEFEALDWSGRTPLHWAAQFGLVDVADLLIQSGAEVDRQENDGSTPLHWAAREGHHEFVRWRPRARRMRGRNSGGRPASSLMTTSSPWPWMNCMDSITYEPRVHVRVRPGRWHRHGAFRPLD